MSANATMMMRRRRGAASVVLATAALLVALPALGQPAGGGDIPLFQPAPAAKPKPKPAAKPKPKANPAQDEPKAEAPSVEPVAAEPEPAAALEPDAPAEARDAGEGADENSGPVVPIVQPEEPPPVAVDPDGDGEPVNVAPVPGATPSPAGAAAAQASQADDATNDGPVTVTTKIKPDPSFVGDLLTLEVTAAYPTGYRVNLPTGVDFAPLHLVAIEEGEPEASGEGYFRKVFTITLQHFETGDAKVPGFPLTYVGQGGEVETVRVAPRAFTVDSLLANEAEPERKGEDPPVSLEYPNRTAELVIYSALIAMIAGFLLALLWRRFASKPKVVLGPPPVPAHERALTALAELEGSDLLETGLVQDYYLELTEIAKGYLEGRFGVDALDRTTEEIRRDLIRNRERIKPLEPKDVLRFLEGCDLVKFARFDPELDEARAALGEVRTMVEETRPAERAAASMPEKTGESSDGAEPGEAPAEKAAAGETPESEAPAADDAAQTDAEKDERDATKEGNA
ncbi:MAG: hypothetical protein KC486_12390 [Myxococcales bacterium]|nr:hypothetical protein [Myxococcales bacterium]